MFAPPVAKPKRKGESRQRRAEPAPRPGRAPLPRAELLRRAVACQPKLKVGAAHDPLELEADRVAAQVMRTPEPDLAIGAGQPPTVQPKLRAGAAGAPLRAERTGPSPDSFKGRGSPLVAPVRGFFERRFGYDFGGVRVHDGPDAAASARSLGARAYTYGRDIVFGAGEYSPGSRTSQALLAHELAHVVQQSRSDAVPIVQRQISSVIPPIRMATGMDPQGESILGTWLYGGGARRDVEDPDWTAYMQRHEAMRRQIFGRLIHLVQDVADRKSKGRYPLAQTFHAEFPENRGYSGYALLHGSDATVGDFRLTGWADVQDAADLSDGGFDIELDLRFVFNDIVDPNRNYASDRRGAILAHIVTLGQPRDYLLSIHWSSNCLAEVREGRSIRYYGYPSDRPLPIRRLPQAKLDWVGSEKKRANEIEAGILNELRRNFTSEEVAGLAERKRRLLWMFYRLSGYMGGVYVSRFSNPAHDDDLPRLFHDRISGALRAELMEALRGKRPGGKEPK